MGTSGGTPAQTDFLLEAALGNIEGIDHINKFGRNPDIDQAGSINVAPVGRDIWDLGINGAVLWVPPTAARIHQIASDDDEDGGAGTDAGALTIRIYGLDADFLLQQEDLTLNGTTNVPTANAYTMIHRMEVLTAGSASRNLGHINATADTDSTVTARITIDMNQTLMAIYQVPAGKTAYVTVWHSSLHKVGGVTTFADVFLMSMKFGGVWRVRDSASLSLDGAPHSSCDLLPYKVLEAREYIKIVGNPSKDSQDMAARFDLILVDD